MRRLPLTASTAFATDALARRLTLLRSDFFGGTFANLLDGDLVYLAGVLIYVGVVTVLRDFHNFGDDDIAVLLQLLTPRRHLQGSLDLVGRSHPREEHVAVVHVHHFRRLISKHFRVDAALEDVVIELAFCDPIQAEYSLRDVGVLARDVVRGKGSEHTLADLLLCIK